MPTQIAELERVFEAIRPALPPAAVCAGVVLVFSGAKVWPVLLRVVGGAIGAGAGYAIGVAVVGLARESGLSIPVAAGPYVAYGPVVVLGAAAAILAARLHLLLAFATGALLGGLLGLLAAGSLHLASHAAAVAAGCALAVGIASAGAEGTWSFLSTAVAGAALLAWGTAEVARPWSQAPWPRGVVAAVFVASALLGIALQRRSRAKEG